MTKLFLSIIFLLFGFSTSVFADEGRSISCFTNYAGEILVSGKIRIQAVRRGLSLSSLELNYFNGQRFVATTARIIRGENPDTTYKPRTYKGYLRYVLGAGREGEGYELLLPEDMRAEFKGYISYFNFEGSTPRFELICRSSIGE